MKKSQLSTCSLIALLLLSPCTKAHAEMMDYNSLQDLFGEPVTTAATGTPQVASDVATNMTIITQDQIRQAGTRDIPAIIGMYSSGIDVLQSGKQGFDVGVRGYQQPNQPRLLVLIDGRQVFIDDYSRTLWTSLPVNVDDIRQIEVVKGPSSALFGSNAAGGVVNIITKNPLFDTGNVASVTVGTGGLASGDATAMAKIGSIGGVKISAGGLNADEFGSSRMAREGSTKTDPERRYISGVGNFQINPKIQASVEGTYSESQDTEAAFTRALFGQESKNSSIRLGGSWQSPWGVWTSNNYLNHHDISARPSDFTTRFGLVTDLVVSQLENQFKIGADHTFRLALEYRNKKFNLNYLDPSFNVQNPETTENNYAAGATWLWNATDKLSFTNALRIDHLDMKETGAIGATSVVTDSDYSHSINELSANSGVVYKATNLDTFRLTYGRGVQMPSLIQTGFSASLPTHTPTVYLDVQGGPDLKPTIVQNYELGYDRGLPQINSKARFAVYYQLNQDLIGINPNRPISVVAGNVLARTAAINLGNSQGFGGELELKGSSQNGFRWMGSYSLAKVVDADMVKSVLAYTHSAPEHQVKANLGYTLQQWDFDVNGRYASSTMMPRYDNTNYPLTSTDGYITVGARIGYNLNERFSLAVSGTNINREQTAMSPYPDVERQGMLTFTGKF